MNRRFLIVSAGAALVAGGYALLAPGTGAPLPVGMALAQEGEVDTSRVMEMAMGDPEAPVTVIEYASFTCPHCGTFHKNVLPELKANYIETGKVRFVYREVYFDRFGLWAGMLARCTGPDRYFGMVDMLYASQSDWIANGDPATVAGNLRKLGRTAGLSEEEVAACLQDGEMARALVAVYQENAEADDVTSTPSFVIDGEKYGNMNYAEFSGILDEKLGG